jgi:hypothetical protein
MFDARMLDDRLTRACLGKRAFPSRKNATGAAINAARREMENARTPEEQKRSELLQAYRCRLCGRWHIGHSTVTRPRLMRSKKTQTIVPTASKSAEMHRILPPNTPLS